MSSDAMVIQAAEAQSESWIQVLHEWVTTVDHKRLGILYILFALTFLVLGGIEAAERAGLTPIKINTVVQRGVNDHTVVDLARYFKDRGHIVRFIEYMDVGNLNGWRMDDVVPGDDIVAMTAEGS